MNTQSLQSLQSLAQLQALQSMSSVGTSDMNPTNSTSDFAQMLAQLTDSTPSTSDATQLLGLSNSLSNSSSSSYLSSYSPINSLLGSASSTDYNQFLGSIGNSASTIDFNQVLNNLGNTTSGNYSQLLSTLTKNPSNNTNKSLYYNGTSPVYTPESVLNNYYQTLNKVTNPQAGSTSVSSNRNYDAIIKKAAQTYGIPEKMIKSVIQQESGFNNQATSSVGAGGLMQLMPGTAKYLGVSNVYDAEQNIMGGTKYLKQLYDQFDGSYSLMLAAYNAGPGAVSKYGGIPPYKETTNYVHNIMNTYKA